MLVNGYCVSCFKQLAKYGELAQLCYVDICEHFVLYEIPYEINTDVHACSDGKIQICRFLELKGFVLSTECDKNSIRFIPIGHKELEEDFNVFCPFGCKRFEVNE